MSCLRNTLTLLLLAANLFSYSQKTYTVRTYSTENGMPSNGIKGLYWDDSTRFLWIATEAGVVRFNGIDFKNFTSQNTPGLSSERMIFLSKNYEGRVQTSDQDRNTFRIEKNRLVFEKKYTVKPGEPNNLFLISASEALLRSNLNKRNKYTYFPPFDKLIQIDDTSCYLRKDEHLHFYSTHEEREVQLPDLINGAKAVFKIGKAIFVQDNANQIFLLNTKTEKTHLLKQLAENGKPFNPSKKENLIYWEFGMSKPVFFSGSEAWLLDTTSNGDISFELIASSVPTDSYIQCAQYSEKWRMLFIGTDSKGIIVISENKVQPMKSNRRGSNERNAYYGQLELPNGNVLTNEGRVVGTNPSSAGPLPISGPFVLSLFKTNDSLLWYNSTTKYPRKFRIHCYNQKTGKTIVYDKLYTNGLHSLVSCNGRIYLSHSDGFGYLEGDSMHYIFPKEKWMYMAYDMQEVEKGILFIASCNNLLRFNTYTEKLDTIYKANDCCVRSIWKYGEYIFFGTYGKGFFAWKNGVVKQMPLDKNKYLLYAHCFMPDREGYCWISTNRGLFKARIDELINAWDHPSEQVYYHYFGKNDGMDITEMNGGCVPCAIELKNRTLSFPTMDGLLWVNPEKEVSMLPSGEIYVDEVIVNGKSVNIDSLQSKELPSKRSEIVIKLGYAAWCNKENIYIDYQLSDDDTWKALSTDNEATLRFNNLPSGTYHLRLRKLNGFGINNYTYKEIKFTISTPWYKQLWFAFIVAAAFLGIVLLIFQLRLRQHKRQQRKLELQVAEKTSQLLEKTEGLEKADRIKTRLISIISHDIITPLKFLAAGGKNLLEKRKQMPEELQHETIQEMTNTSLELQLLSTNILNWIKYQNENRRLVKEEFNVFELVESVFSILKSMAAQKNIQLENKVDRTLIINQYYEPLKILIYNLVTNAINFSDKGTISVNNSLLNDKVLLSVKDEGVGMTKEQVDNILSKEFIISSTNVDNRKGNGLGYLIIKDLVKMMGTNLDIQSEKGKGTKVSLLV